MMMIHKKLFSKRSKFFTFLSAGKPIADRLPLGFYALLFTPEWLQEFVLYNVYFNTAGA